MKRVITLAGKVASGKSDVSKILSEKLGYNIYRASDYFREQARKAGMQLAEFNKYLMAHPEVDTHIDRGTQEFMCDKEDYIVDARLGFFMVEDVFDVYLNVDLETATDRLYSGIKVRGSEENYKTREQTKSEIEKRELAERERYLYRYNVDIMDMKNYTLVVDTTNLTQEEVADKIIAEYTKWLSKAK